MRITLMPRRTSGSGDLRGAIVSFPSPGEPSCVKGPGFQDGECQEMVLLSRKGPIGLTGALEGIDAKGRRRKLPGTFDYNIQKVAGSNFAVERER